MSGLTRTVVILCQVTGVLTFFFAVMPIADLIGRGHITRAFSAYEQMMVACAGLFVVAAGEAIKLLQKILQKG